MQLKIMSPLGAGLFVTFLAGVGSGAVAQLMVPPALTATVTSPTKTEVSNPSVSQLVSDRGCNTNTGQQEADYSPSEGYNSPSEGQGGDADGDEGEAGIGSGGSL